MNTKKTIEIIEDYSNNVILIFEADCLEGNYNKVFLITFLPDRLVPILRRNWVH